MRSQITFGLDTKKSEEWVFLTRNATVVKAHIGSTAILPCEVKKDSQFGMVSLLSVLTAKTKMPSSEIFKIFSFKNNSALE